MAYVAPRTKPSSIEHLPEEEWMDPCNNHSGHWTLGYPIPPLLIITIPPYSFVWQEADDRFQKVVYSLLAPLFGPVLSLPFQGSTAIIIMMGNWVCLDVCSPKFQVKFAVRNAKKHPEKASVVQLILALKTERAEGKTCHTTHEQGHSCRKTRKSDNSVKLFFHTVALLHCLLIVKRPTERWV